MFSTKAQLDRKTGEDGIGRYDFLKLLIQEFEKSKSYASKKQVLANLANFSYDPINFNFLRDLRVLDLFLAQLSQNNEELLHIGLAGICNLSTEPENKEYIVHSNGVYLISEQLLHQNEDIGLNALTTLIYLMTPESQAEITTPSIINKVLHYQHSENTRFRNLATIFLQDYCTKDQVNAVIRGENLGVDDIPLPV